MLFGTFRNPVTFEYATGFYNGASDRILDMLRARDISSPGDPVHSGDHLPKRDTAEKEIVSAR